MHGVPVEMRASQILPTIEKIGSYSQSVQDNLIKGGSTSAQVMAERNVQLGSVLLQKDQGLVKVGSNGPNSNYVRRKIKSRL